MRGKFSGWTFQFHDIPDSWISVPSQNRQRLIVIPSCHSSWSYTQKGLSWKDFFQCWDSYPIEGGKGRDSLICNPFFADCLLEMTSKSINMAQLNFDHNGTTVGKGVMCALIICSKQFNQQLLKCLSRMEIKRMFSSSLKRLKVATLSHLC